MSLATRPVQQTHTAVIIVAAGASNRMAGVDKIFSPILGVPLIVHTIDAFESSPQVQELVLVLSPEKVALGRTLAEERGWNKLSYVCAGGVRRQDSVSRGLGCLTATEWVTVHDGARPCIDTSILKRGLDAAGETGAAVAAVPTKDTIKLVSDQGQVESTLPRDRLWMVQTPQVFKYDLLVEAHRSCQGAYNDDAAMVESLGHKVKVFMGSYDNIKVTTPEDLAVAEVLLRRKGALDSSFLEGHVGVGG